MKKLISLLISLALIFSLSLQAGACTTYSVKSNKVYFGKNWDFDANARLDVIFSLKDLGNDVLSMEFRLGKGGFLCSSINNKGFYATCNQNSGIYPITDPSKYAGMIDIRALHENSVGYTDVSEVEDLVNEKGVWCPGYPEHVFFADAHGDALLVEPNNKDTYLTHDENNFLVATNFPLYSLDNLNDLDSSPCGRYNRAYENITERISDFDLYDAIYTLKYSSQRWTNYSFVCDPAENVVYLYLNNNPDRIWKMSFADRKISTYYGFKNYKEFELDEDGVLFPELENYEFTETVVEYFSAVSSGCNSIELTWDSVKYVDSYELYRSTSENGTYSKIANLDYLNPFYTDKNVTTGTKYFYKVRAKFYNGIITDYSYANATPMPTIPSNFKAVSNSYSSVKLSWNGVAGATGYQVFRSTSQNGTYSWAGTTSSPSFLNNYLTTGTTYYYKVRAFKGNFYGDFSSAVSAKPMPSVPAGVKGVSASYSSVKITWNTVLGASGYQVFRSTSQNGTYSWAGTVTSTSFTNNYLTTGKTYYYKVRAYRGNNYGNFSGAVSVKPVPATPANFTATRAGTTSIKVKWNGVSGASGYEIFRATSQGGVYSLIKTTTSTSYTNNGLTRNKYYYYKVRAYRIVNGVKVYGAFSVIKSAKSY